MSRIAQPALPITAREQRLRGLVKPLTPQCTTYGPVNSRGHKELRQECWLAAADIHRKLPLAAFRTGTVAVTGR
jgi:hypothetical protein